MTEPYTVQDLISLSYEQKPIDFSDAFNSLISSKIAGVIDDRKIEVAQTMFAAPGEVDIEDDSVDQFEEDEEYGTYA